MTTPPKRYHTIRTEGSEHTFDGKGHRKLQVVEQHGPSQGPTPSAWKCWSFPWPPTCSDSAMLAAAHQETPVWHGRALDNVHPFCGMISSIHIYKLVKPNQFNTFSHSKALTRLVKEWSTMPTSVTPLWRVTLQTSSATVVRLFSPSSTWQSMALSDVMHQGTPSM